MDREKLQKEFDRIVSIIQLDDDGFGALQIFVSELKVLREGKSPASVKHHHNGDYGLLEHTIEVCEILEHMADNYNLDKKFLLTAGLLHDIGKLYEYDRSGGKLIKIDNGNINHTQYVYSILKHNGYCNLANIIGTHMGRREWGAIRDVEDTESKYNWALHLADMISAKLGE